MNKKQNSGNAHAYFSVAMTVAPKTFANNFWVRFPEQALA